MLAYRLGDGAEDYTFFRQRVAERGLDRHGVHYRIHSHVSCQSGTLLQGNTEFVEGLGYLGVDFIYLLVICHLVIYLGGSIVRDVLKVDVGYIQVRPFGYRHREPFAIGFQSELQQPGRLAFLHRNSTNNILVQSFADDVRLYVGGKAVLVLAGCNFFYDLVLCHVIVQ